MKKVRRSASFWLLLAFTLVVCAFLVVPVFMSVSSRSLWPLVSFGTWLLAWL